MLVCSFAPFIKLFFVELLFTDTHTHLYSKEFENDSHQMLQRAFDNGVKRLFVPSIDSSYTSSMKALQQLYPEHIFLMMGLHPCYVKPESYEKELEWVAQELKSNTYYAVGEIGIDLYWDKSTLDIQKEAFKKQIQWAKQHKLGINIHCREAFDEVFEVLESEKSDDLFGIFHCFSGNLEQANQAIRLGMKLGIGGVVTFKNGKIDQFLHQISLKDIVLETDAPYLAPVPYRGKRNESSYIPIIAQKLAEIHQVSIAEIAEITTNNAKEIFSI
ncbi:TatD DNase family protein [Flavobacterium croceum DSM 17960]|uniref:TatD DNase family protein n=1 Tax=Flavobacterium croceum DSM 17960 TaxID=1121886 RepID=A0A2S4NB73_9FLAO|nr:TatD family hydrolase [Flavobacterium croceum]POS02935.1 TatD DNase family protein [Flavobacterium croceum DSM 17960]